MKHKSPDSPFWNRQIKCFFLVLMLASAASADTLFSSACYVVSVESFDSACDHLTNGNSSIQSFLSGIYSLSAIGTANLNSQSGVHLNASASGEVTGDT